jgi:3-dehydroquinate synthetase
MGEFVIAEATSVWIGPGAGADTVLAGASPRRVALLAQPGVPVVIARGLAAQMPDAVVVEIPDGESAKTLGVVEGVCRRLAAAGVERGDLLIGVGGGAATDLVGFVAAVYLRGIRVHYVATTLVGAVDAAIGGKTAVNIEAKNQVGVFRHPSRVVIDTAVLEALPPPLRRAGLAEALKAGLVGDPGLVELLERCGGDAPLAEVVERAIRVKAGIVARDFEEAGERAHLNYGHTIGHAIEVAAGISHGDAVAVGMVAAGRVSTLVTGFRDEDRQRAVIAALGLPVTAAGVEASRVRALIARDKKRSSGGLRMVVLAEVGRPQVVAVDDATVTAALAAVGIGG